MHDEGGASGVGDRADEVAHVFVAVLIVNTNAMFDGHVDAGRVLHGFNAISNQLWVGHQASTNHVVLYAITRAANVQVDLVVTPVLSKLSALRQLVDIAATQLKCNRMF